MPTKCDFVYSKLWLQSHLFTIWGFAKLISSLKCKGIEWKMVLLAPSYPVSQPNEQHTNGFMTPLPCLVHLSLRYAITSSDNLLSPEHGYSIVEYEIIAWYTIVKGVKGWCNIAVHFFVDTVRISLSCHDV